MTNRFQKMPLTCRVPHRPRRPTICVMVASWEVQTPAITITIRMIITAIIRATLPGNRSWKIIARRKIIIASKRMKRMAVCRVVWANVRSWLAQRYRWNRRHPADVQRPPHRHDASYRKVNLEVKECVSFWKSSWEFLQWRMSLIPRLQGSIPNFR